MTEPSGSMPAGATSRATHVLPATLTPRPGESIESWLEHLAELNGLSTAAVLTMIRESGAHTRFLTIAPAPETVATVAAIARVSESEVYAATMATFDDTALDLTNLNPNNRDSYRQIAAPGWAPHRGTQICPRCLSEKGVWQSSWRLPIVTSCRRHQNLLCAVCPSCQRPFRDQRHSHLRVVGASTRCGNPLGAGPAKKCRQELTDIRAVPATDDVLATQARIDAALNGAQMIVLGEPVSAASYLHDLRHLATLLLHLAGQTGAERLASWVTGLTSDAVTRTRARGPRWGLRPPDDPGVRSAALAAADGILAAADLDDATAALATWTELTPTTPDGPLGWLADHTVMTPTLTRLVLAARAPHRRLSTLLDHTERLAPLRHIPQMLPTELFERHLADAFDSGPATVRLFTTMCLARTDPRASTWSATGHLLGLPEDLAVRTARACSASLLLPIPVLEARLRSVAADLPHVDWRQCERDLRAGCDDTWFKAFAAERPGTRASSRPYAVAWVWTQLAHGHLSATPAWAHPPTSADRAGFRKFSRGLSEGDRARLSRIGGGDWDSHRT